MSDGIRPGFAGGGAALSVLLTALLVAGLWYRGSGTPGGGDRSASGDGTVEAWALGRHDFGAVPAESTVKHTFVARNASRVPWRLGTPTVSCGCISIGAWTPAVEPGGDCSLEVILDTRDMEGEVEQAVTAALEDSRTLLRWVVRATIVSPARAAPSPLVVPVESGGAGFTAAFAVVVPRSESALRFSREETSPWIRSVDLAIRPGGGDAPSVEYAGTLTGSIPPGLSEVAGVVILRAGGDDAARNVTLPVRCIRRHPISLSPKRLVVAKRPSRSARAEIHVVSRSGGDPGRLDVTLEPASLGTARYDERERAIRLHLAADARARAGRLRAALEGHPPVFVEITILPDEGEMDG